VIYLARSTQPVVIEPSPSWRWYAAPSMCPHDSLLGEDEEGQRWLVKARSCAKAYREVFFSRLARHFGLSYLEYVFVDLGKVVLPSSVRLPVKYTIHAASPWIEFKGIASLLELPCTFEGLEAAESSFSVRRLFDLPKIVVLAGLLGASEDPEFRFTPSKDLIGIDGEGAFAAHPLDLADCEWILQAREGKSDRGSAAVKQLLSAFAALTDSEISTLTRHPLTSLDAAADCAKARAILLQGRACARSVFSSFP